jgi:hypothetical protein
MQLDFDLHIQFEKYNFLAFYILFSSSWTTRAHSGMR